MHDGAHVENVYGLLAGDHGRTLDAFQRDRADATVIGDTICNGNKGNKYAVKDSLLAGGGGVSSHRPTATPGADGDHGQQIARCLGANTPRTTVIGIAGLSRSSGYFQWRQLLRRLLLRGAIVWENNVWDDNLELIPLP